MFLVSASGSSQLRSVVISSLNGGAAQRLQIDPAPFAQLRASRDGTRIAYGKDDGREADIWVFALSGKTVEQKLTFDGRSRHPGRGLPMTASRFNQNGTASGESSGSLPMAARSRALTKADEGETHIPQSFSLGWQALYLFSILKDSVYSLYMLTVANKKAVPFDNLKSMEPFSAVSVT